MSSKMAQPIMPMLKMNMIGMPEACVRFSKAVIAAQRGEPRRVAGQFKAAAVYSCSPAFLPVSRQLRAKIRRPVRGTCSYLCI